MNQRTLNVDGTIVYCYEDGSVVTNTTTMHHRKGSPDSWGYLRINIGRKSYSVARLICIAFHGDPPKDKPQCDHINRKRTDNRSSNLRWVSNSENIANTGVVINSILVHRGIRRVDNERLYRKIHNELFEITVRLPNGKMTTRRCETYIKPFLLAVNIGERLDILARFGYERKNNKGL